MADSRSALAKRVVSALLGAALILSLGYFGGRSGLYVVVTIAIVLGIREYARMAFTCWSMPASINYFFWGVSVFFYALMVQVPTHGLVAFALANVLFFVGTLWLTRDQVTNENLLPALALGTFGMLYCVLFPYYAVRVITLDDGPTWFFFLLLVVFAGDIFAYFGGRFWGRRKFMPRISPNKTWEGCLAGLTGSVVVGVTMLALLLPAVPWTTTLAFCLICGFSAQSGDLLMSLIKRVAKVKDTGHLMPGHGGILDRLDGVFIACPLVYAYAVYSG